MKKENKGAARPLRGPQSRAVRPSTKLGASPSTKLGASPSTKLGASPSTKLGPSPTTSPSTELAASLTVSKGREGLDTVSELTTNRISVYLRCLNALDTAGVRTVSSQALAEQFHLNAAQIRKDLAYFGEFGVRGVGYYVRELRSHLRQILGLDQRVRVGILGAGNLGLALADYPGFQIEGFEIAALFDTVQDKIGQHSRGGVPIFDIADLRRIVRKERIRIAVIAVPASAAGDVVEKVVDAGIKAILNFSPGTIKVPDDVKIKSVDLTVSLESLSFFLAQGDVDEA